MVKLHLQGRSFEMLREESVLDRLLDAGIAVPHGCRSGLCHSCLLQVNEGEIPAKAQQGLRDTQLAQGFILACQCFPEQDLQLTIPDRLDLMIESMVERIDPLSDDTLRVTMQTAQRLNYHPGQFVTLQRKDGVSRSYSLASLPQQSDRLELHIKRVPNGQMSGWFFEPETVGSRLELQGPLGDCFYVDDRPEQPLLLVGTGTGLAPLYGIVRDALQQGHRGPIHLFHGALHRRGLYLHRELQALAAEHANLHYSGVLLEGEEDQDVVVSDLQSFIKVALPQLNGFRAFLCGPEKFVVNYRRQLFLAGVSMKDIYADPFSS